MTIRCGARSFLVVSAAVTTSLLVGAALGIARPSMEASLIGVIVAACGIPLALRAFRGAFDIFEPLVIANVAFVVMYGARPAAIILNGEEPGFKGYDLSGTIRDALVAACLGVCCFQLGYWVCGRIARPTTQVAFREAWNVPRTVVWAVAIAAVGATLFAMFLKQSGGFGVVTSFLAGRDSSQDQLYAGSSAYMYGAPALFWPASLLLIACGFVMHRKRLIVGGLALMLPLLLFAGGQGSRITLLPLLLTPFVFIYLLRERRPRALTLLVVGYLLLTVGIAFFRETRTTSAHVNRGRELISAVRNPGYELQQLVGKGVDNDMFESLAAELQVVPSRLPASPFNYVYRTLAKPVPSTLWPNKPLAPSEQLTKALYPSEQSRASSSSGLVGDLYLAGQLPAVAFGMALSGFLLRLPWERLRSLRTSSVNQLCLAAFLMFIPILLRGAIGDTAARAFFGFVPLLVALRFCTQKAPVGAGSSESDLVSLRSNRTGVSDRSSVVAPGKAAAW
jgi:hypothetical protein